MDRLSETAAAAKNATIASQDNNTAPKLVDALPTISVTSQDDAVPFDEKYASGGAASTQNKDLGAPTKESNNVFQEPPTINWTPSNEEDMAEKLLPAGDVVGSSVTTAAAETSTQTVDSYEKNKATGKEQAFSTSSAKSKVSVEHKTVPAAPTTTNKENNQATTPKREYKKKRSWLSLSPGLRRLKSSKRKDKEPLLVDEGVPAIVNDALANLKAPASSKTTVATTGDFMKDPQSTAKGTDNRTEEKANATAGAAEEKVGELVGLTASAPAFSEAIEEMNTTKEKVVKQVTEPLDVILAAGSEGELPKKDNQDIFRKKEAPSGATRKFPSAYDIANTVVIDLKGTSEAKFSTENVLKDATAAATADLAEANDKETLVASGKAQSKPVVTTVAEGIEDVKAAEERNWTRSVSMDEDDYVCVALDQCVLETASSGKEALALEGDELGDQTEKATNRTSSKSVTTSETESKEAEESDGSRARSKEVNRKGTKKNKWWKAPLKSLSPKRNRKSSKQSTPEPSAAGVSIKASSVRDDETETLVADEIHREFVAANAVAEASTAGKKSAGEEGSAFATFEKVSFEPPATIKEAPSTTRKSMDWEEIVAHSDIRESDMRVGRILLSFQLVLGLIVGAMFFSTTPSATLLRNSACAPVSPWSELSAFEEMSSVFNAPWWIPMSLRSDQVFDIVCGGERPRTKVEWNFQKQTKTDKMYRMVISETDGRVLLDKKTLISASFSNDGILTNTTRGKQELSRAPWNL